MRLIGFTAIVLFSAIGVYFIRKYGFGIGEKPSGESEKSLTVSKIIDRMKTVPQVRKTIARNLSNRMLKNPPKSPASRQNLS